MKRVFITSLAIGLIFFTACKNSDNKKNGALGENLKERADSLYQQVIDIHNEGMAGWMKIEKKQELIRNLLDSIEALPAKMKTAAEPYRIKLEEAFNKLGSAYTDMDEWMPTLNLDSAKNDHEKRIDYFIKEKIKAKSISEAISNSLQKADSLLKARF